MQELTEPQKKWIAALRSGKYKRGVGVLNRGGCLCAIGVACEALKDDLGLKCEPFIGFGPTIITAYDRQTICAPDKLVDHLRLFSSCGSDKAGRAAANVAALSDYGWTFEQIADLLEKYPHLYFKPECKS